ncbi:uncharacterized protein GGS25DRAFT_511239 [Hypoxylon fragiforme]|uniref:uncharacterized protein n=1 Tax=Hypoxylon fragiforme TaxID=63214 RepID=UPI0020C66BD5|nr:uncharacterized protein GGS25DRAFT_511239 [Hypoxylon fragiforme]KAI2603407.1 hypothetical protein GGS25DRAFT_511239 [Hypoxylon fragiforme]
MVDTHTSCVVNLWCFLFFSFNFSNSQFLMMSKLMFSYMNSPTIFITGCSCKNINAQSLSWHSPRLGWYAHVSSICLITLHANAIFKILRQLTG